LNRLTTIAYFALPALNLPFICFIIILCSFFFSQLTQHYKTKSRLFPVKGLFLEPSKKQPRTVGFVTVFILRG
jgi:hypothetical protein